MYSKYIKSKRWAYFSLNWCKKVQKVVYDLWQILLFFNTNKPTRIWCKSVVLKYVSLMPYFFEIKKIPRKLLWCTTTHLLKSNNICALRNSMQPNHSKFLHTIIIKFWTHNNFSMYFEEYSFRLCHSTLFWKIIR